MLGRMLRNRSVDARIRSAAAAASSAAPFLSRRPAAAQMEKLDPRRLLSAGTIDTSFGTGGLLTQDFGFGDDFGNAITVQSDGKILVAGTVRGSASNDFGVARFNSDGTLDTSFGTGGRVVTDFGSGSTSVDDARSIEAIVCSPGAMNRCSSSNSALVRARDETRAPGSIYTPHEVVGDGF